MPRPRRCRYVQGRPATTYFKPRGVPLRLLAESRLTVEGLEALRLADLEGMTAGQAAERMQISRHTFGRVLQEARRAVAEALVHGRALCIEGGTHEYLSAAEGRSGWAEGASASGSTCAPEPPDASEKDSV